MIEVQNHGFLFEEWVAEYFFSLEIKRGSHKWDIDPTEPLYSPSKEVPKEFKGINISIKSIKKGFPIGLGDIIRQRSISEDFGMICGFWEQSTKNYKNILNIVTIRFAKQQWQDLWGDLSLKDIQTLDKKIKDRNIDYEEAKRIAKEWKKQFQNKSPNFVVNPKIDSKTQRRVQTSLPFKKIIELAKENPSYREAGILWETNFPNPIRSKRRVFKKS